MSFAAKVWRGVLIFVIVGGLLAMVFHVNVMAPVNAWFVHQFPMFGSPQPTGTPIAGGPMPSATPDLGQSELHDAVASFQTQTAATARPSPTVHVPQAPQVTGGAAKAGLAPAQTQPVPSEATSAYERAQQELNAANAMVPNSSLGNPFAMPGINESGSQPFQAATPGPPVVQTPPPALVNPHAASMFGVTQGQVAGAAPQTLAQMSVAEQASFLTGSDTSQADAYTTGELEPARSNDEVWPGDPIDCILKKTVQTDEPGIAICVVTRDVRSHLPPYDLLIPATSEFWGPYNALVVGGQTRVQIRWDDLGFPNGATLPLQSVQAEDTQGMAGVPADVDNHVGRVYTSTVVGILGSALAGLIGARAALSSTPSFGQLAAISGGQQVAQTFSGMQSAAQAQPPTLRVHRGTPIQIGFAAIQVLPPYSKSGLRYAAPRVRDGSAPTQGDGTPSRLISP